jgi:chitin synthase
MTCFTSLLDPFGNAKTRERVNPNASCHGRYFALHFNGRAYGLHKSRSNHLSHEERTYHIFYQLVAGLRGFVYARTFV